VFSIAFSTQCDEWTDELLKNTAHSALFTEVWSTWRDWIACFGHSYEWRPDWG